MFADATTGPVRILTVDPKSDSVLVKNEWPKVIERLRAGQIPDVEGLTAAELENLSSSDAFRRVKATAIWNIGHSGLKASGTLVNGLDDYLSSDLVYNKERYLLEHHQAHQRMNDFLEALPSNKRSELTALVKYGLAQEGLTAPDSPKRLSKLGVVFTVLGLALASSAAAAAQQSGDTEGARKVMEDWAKDAAGGAAGAAIGSAVVTLAAGVAVASGIAVSAPLVAAFGLAAGIIGGIYGSKAATDAWEQYRGSADSDELNLLEQLSAYLALTDFHLVFGTKDAEILSGSADKDYLFGGGAGDTLDGLAGNDVLRGGDGDDIYRYSAGSGVDTVYDSDGQGTIEIDDESLTGGDRVLSITGKLTWADRENKVYFQYLEDSERPGLGELAIFGPGMGGGNNRIVIRDYHMAADLSSGDLGLEFTNTTRLELTAGVQNQNPFSNLEFDEARDEQTASIKEHGAAFLTLFANNVSAEDRKVMLKASGNNDLYVVINNERKKIGSGVEITLEARKASLSFVIGHDGTLSANADIYVTATFTDAQGHVSEAALSLSIGDLQAAEAHSWQPTTVVDSRDVPNHLGTSGADLMVFNEIPEDLFPARSLVGGDGDDVLFAGSYEDAQVFIERGETEAGIPSDPDREQGASRDTGWLLQGNGGTEAGFGADQLFGSAWDDKLIGGSGTDLLAGGGGNDELFADAGDHRFEAIDDADQDVVWAGNGDDYAHGGRDSDVIFGGSGKDVLLGGTGDDYVEGGSDDDYLRGDGTQINMAVYNPTHEQYVSRSGADYLDGGDGNDTLTGEQGSDALYGGNGNDSIIGGVESDYRYLDYQTSEYVLEWVTIPRSEYDARFTKIDDDVIEGGAGNDSLYGGALNDWISGGDDDDYVEGDYLDVAAGLEGADTLYGDAGKDTLIGGNGDDQLDGGIGDDVLDGGDGVDWMVGGAGKDSLYGGAGSDVIEGKEDEDSIFGDVDASLVAAGEEFEVDHEVGESDEVDGGEANDTIYGQGGDDVLAGANGDDQLYGDAGADTLTGGLGDDTLWGDNVVSRVALSKHGADSLDGGAGNDILFGGAGDDQLAGGDGTDYLRGESGNDQLAGGAGNDTLAGDNGDEDQSPGNDTLLGDAGNDSLLGFSGDDSLDGGADNDTLFGSDGNDTLTGGAGIDQLIGGLGNDSLQGGDGDDSLWGNEGADYLDGGAGDDRYEIDLQNPGQDTIADAGGNDTLLFGNGVRPEDLRFGLGSLHITTADGVIDVHIEGFDPSDAEHSPIEFIGFRDLGFMVPTGALLAQQGFAITGEGFVSGTSVKDTLTGSAQGDLVFADAGADLVDGGAGEDFLLGDAGDDSLQGGDDADWLSGGDDHDLLQGGSGADTLDGGAGDDVLDGGVGADQLMGGEGDDTYVVHAGGGIDEIIDDGGTDTLRLDASVAYSAVTFRIVDSRFVIDLGNGDGIAVSGFNALATEPLTIESILFGNGYTQSLRTLISQRGYTIEGSGSIVGSPYKDLILGSAQGDTIEGNGTSDTVMAGDGDDRVDGGDGYDWLYGGQAIHGGVIDGGSVIGSRLRVPDHLVRRSSSVPRRNEGSDDLFRTSGRHWLETSARRMNSRTAHASRRKWRREIAI